MKQPEKGLGRLAWNQTAKFCAKQGRLKQTVKMGAIDTLPDNPDDLYQGIMWYTLSGIELMAHEFGHHIQVELGSQILAGNLPAPDSNTLYMVHFPAGKVIGILNDDLDLYVTLREGGELSADVRTILPHLYPLGYQLDETSFGSKSPRRAGESEC